MFDLLIKNAWIYDGLGNAPQKADIGIKDGEIACVGTVTETAERVIDAAGLAVSPGFIDSHSHADNAVAEYPEWKEVVEQGITTSVAGQCGSSIYPKEEAAEAFFKNLKETPLGGNLVLLIGHGALRKAVMGKENRRPTAEELEQMKKLLADGMEQGARGLSLGLAYVPGAYAETEELIALAKVASSYGGILAAHTRNENDLVIDSVREFITIAREANIRGVISHLKACKKRNWGKVKTLLSMIDEANAAGAEIYMDVYPYVASSTSLSSAFVPKEALTRPNEELAAALVEPALRQEFEAKMKPLHGDNLDWVYVTACKGHPEYAGMFVSEIAERMGRTHYDAVYELLHISDLSCTSCFFSVNEEEMVEIMKHPRSMIGTDSTAAKGRAVYHPRVRGSFVRALGHYARDLGVMPMEQMICKMTSFTAAVYGLKNKGRVAEGYDADLCIFDPQKLIDRADFKSCSLPNEGLHYVLVGGRIAVENGISTGLKAGCFIPFKN
ncbi:MAG: D-aminoacylase [Clostridia bacterium]|nr:D-aminoacylase [Clostridia bacterium]